MVFSGFVRGTPAPLCSGENSDPRSKRKAEREWVSRMTSRTASPQGPIIYLPPCLSRHPPPPFFLLPSSPHPAFLLSLFSMSRDTRRPSHIAGFDRRRLAYRSHPSYGSDRIGALGWVFFRGGGGIQNRGRREEKTCK